MAVASVCRTIWLVLRVAHFLARLAREEPGVLHEASHVLKQIVREVLDLFLLGLHIVVEKIDLEAFRELLIDGIVDEAAVLGSDCLFPCVIGFGQIEAVERVGVLLEEACEVLSGGHRVLVDVLVEHYVGLHRQWVRDLRPEEGDRTSHLDEGAHLRLGVRHGAGMPPDNLLNLDPVGNVAFLVDASSQVSRSSKMPTPSC